MTLAKDTLNTLLWLPINSIPLCLHRGTVAGSSLILQRAERPAIAVTCTAYTPAKRFNWCLRTVLALCTVVHLPRESRLMIGKKIQNIQFLSLQSRSDVQQPSNTRQPRWVEQGLSVPWPQGTRSSSPAPSGIKSGSRDHCNAKQSGGGHSKAPLSDRTEVAARSILSPAQPDGNHPNLFPALRLQSRTTELGKPAVPCSA